MLYFKKIVNDIKEIKIQGATNIAKAAAKAIYSIAYHNKHESRSNFISELYKARTVLVRTRPTEPAMRNTLNYILFDIEKEEDYFQEVKNRASAAIKHFQESKEKIGIIGSKKILNNSIIFTHCHSSIVINVFKNAKKQGKRFQVHNTETRPLYQGRITAKEVSKLGIPVTHYIDSAARLALKKSDLMLIGADVITSEGKIINKIGSEMFAEVAEKYGVPVYVCSDAWKFDPVTVFGNEEIIESRESKEVWPNVPNGVRIINFSFEKINPDLISGVISELGVYTPGVFVEEVKRAYPWMF